MGVKVYQVLEHKAKSTRLFKVKVYGSDQVMHLTNPTLGNVWRPNLLVLNKSAIVFTIPDQSWEQVLKCGFNLKIDKSI
jgi:hypothetical protein